MKKFILKGPYLADPDENRMLNEGNTKKAREDFLRKRFRNLDFLLRQRFSWMNEFIQEGDLVWEVGAGAAFTELYLEKKIKISDVVKNEWVDLQINATEMSFEDESVDVIIASHTIHHFSSPFAFFKECERVLKPGGVILVSEIHTSTVMRFMLRLMRHEGWSYKPNVFDPRTIANDPSDPWSANCAIPEMLFSNIYKFEKTFQQLTVEFKAVQECFLFPVSGGVIAKTKVPELPAFILKSIVFLDKLLVKLSPNIFGMGLSVAIRKKI